MTNHFEKAVSVWTSLESDWISWVNWMNWILIIVIWLYLNELDWLGDTSDVPLVCCRLKACNLTVTCCENLSNGIRSSQIRELDLSNNNLTDAGLRQLSDGLKTSKLETLRSAWPLLHTESPSEQLSLLFYFIFLFIYLDLKPATWQRTAPTPWQQSSVLPAASSEFWISQTTTFRMQESEHYLLVWEVLTVNWNNSCMSSVVFLVLFFCILYVLA